MKKNKLVTVCDICGDDAFIITDEGDLCFRCSCTRAREREGGILMGATVIGWDTDGTLTYRLKDGTEYHVLGAI